MAGPLAGLRVIDLTSVLMGPFTTQILGDLGADVIKIESPQGDTVRHIGTARNPAMGPCFLHVNRSKRSVVLDLKLKQDRQAILELAKTADIFMSNVRPAAMARLQLGYEDVCAANPRIIYVSLVGYGQDGPYAQRAAYDDMIQAVCAVPSLVAQAGDGVPRYVPLAMVDRIVGQAAATATLAAVVHRDKTGRGQRVEIPMFETMVPYVMGEHMMGLTFDPPLGPPGYPRLLASTRQAYPTRDGFVCALVYTDKHWQSFFELVGQPDRCSTDPRLASIGNRTTHINDLYAEVSAFLLEHSTAYWLEALKAVDIPVMPLHTLESLLEDPHLHAVNYFEMVDHPTEGRVRQMPPLGRWSDSVPDSLRPAPTLGQHTDEVLAEIGRGRGSSCPIIEEK
jgi:crotonobetainyl-CoA:carnitine CoA-transferase CaiB-like acyl-CoA transferase